MDQRVLKVIDTIDRLYADNLSLPALSETVNLSPSRLRCVFKEETGWSPMQYLKARRMACAEHLLLNTFLGIKQVAFLSGATNVSYFVREFKKWYGQTPSDFRTRFGSSTQGPKLLENAGE